MRIVKAIVPAAGLSTRFGGLNKLLVNWNGRPMVAAAVDVLLDCGLEVIVVTGRDSELVEVAVCGPGSPKECEDCKESPSARSAPSVGKAVRCVFNPDFATGLGTSIAAGVRAACECDAFLMALGDMPSLRSDVVQTLIKSFRLGAIVVPIYEAEPTRFGHPILFCSSYRSALEALTGERGAKSIIEANQDNIVQISFSGALDDIDVPQ